jgi:hypothetical protein
VQEAADRLAGTGSAVYYWVNSRPVRDTNYLNRSLASTGSFLAPLFGASQFERYSCVLLLRFYWMLGFVVISLRPPNCAGNFEQSMGG